eukprot:190090-Prorocentrum_lima.AAC.1
MDDATYPSSLEEFVASPLWQQWMQSSDARLQVLGDFTDDDIIKAMTYLPAGLRESLLLTEQSSP